MKKLVALLLAVILCLSLCACGKSEAVTACEELIGKIGTVTLDSEAAIVAAEEAYNALSDSEKGQLSEAAETLTNARDTYDDLVAEAERQAQLQAKLDAVVALIDAIGELTPDSESAIVAAENAYASLSDAEKAMIQEKGNELASLRATFDTAVMEAAAAEVVEAINAIGDVTLESQEVIEAVKAQYNALPSAAQAMVTNYDVLTSAETLLADLVAAEKQRIIDEYSSNFEVEEDRVQNLAWYMHYDMPEYIDTRSYIIPYIGVQNGNPWICIRYNYTEDDWVFWEYMTIVADGQKYYKYVGYFNTIRDNDGGVVWEYYDEPLNYNQGLDTEQLQMLQAIADSEETIVRFEGDDYYYDLYVSETDKEIIRDVLALYSALLK